jgi:hypothetical protein
MSRHANKQWNLREISSGNTLPPAEIELALLMDIRDELQKLNALLHCGNFLSIPHKLERIARNTAKPRTKKVAR